MEHLKPIIMLAIICIGAVTTSCSQSKSPQKGTSKADFGKDNAGAPVSLYTLVNNNGVTMKVTDYGCIITSICVPDKNGKMGDIALGYDTVADYIKATPYFGAIVGRYGNRIANGKFTVDGKEYKPTINLSD